MKAWTRMVLWLLVALGAMQGCVGPDRDLGRRFVDSCHFSSEEECDNRWPTQLW